MVRPPPGPAGEAGTALAHTHTPDNALTAAPPAPPAPSIDWPALEAALARLPPELRDPAFDPLRYALRVLARPDAETALAEV